MLNAVDCKSAAPKGRYEERVKSSARNQALNALVQLLLTNARNTSVTSRGALTKHPFLLNTTPHNPKRDALPWRGTAPAYPHEVTVRSAKALEVEIRGSRVVSLERGELFAYLSLDLRLLKRVRR